MMSFSRGAIAGNLGLVFASGAVVGGFGHSLYTAASVVAHPSQKPEEMRKMFVDAMRTRLKLNDDQVMKLNLILDESRGRFHEAQAKMKPELDSIRKDQLDSVRSMLTADQRAEYERFLKEREEQRKHNGPHNGPGF